MPGVAVSQSGSIGSQTQVRIRGAEANQVLVLIDGIKANDPAGNDEFGFQDLTTWDVDRIEVVRGAQSALWGSDALAGVINVITRQPDEELSAGGFAEGGTFDTVAAGGRVGGKRALGTRAGLSVSGSRFRRIQQLAHGRRRRWLREHDGVADAGGPSARQPGPGLCRPLHRAPPKSSTAATSCHGPASRLLAMNPMWTLGYFGAGGTLRLLDDRWTQSLRAALDDDRHG